jgi:hypothetical protein
MPNGGSDCCGTCWFNAKNKGEAGYAHARGPEPSFCSIRNLPIDSPFYTYCGNHPRHRPERDPIPIGPVFRGDSTGAREPWSPSPDTEEIRQHLLALLEPEGEADPVVIEQLGEFREIRALAGLRRIASLNRPAEEQGRAYRDWLVDLAREAIAKIESQLG